MTMSTRPFLIALCSGMFAAGLTVSSQQPASPLAFLTLPTGFRADVFAANVDNAREMVLGTGGTVFVGSAMEVFAEGVRNSVGFDWHPVTRELWFTDNGRDAQGDDVPADELNVAPKAGLHFGFPYCHQGDVTDPQFGAERACSTTEPPVQKLGAHVAAIGFTFYTGSMFPASYKNAAIIAEHGSWNRTKPSGYRVMVVRTDERRATSYEPLVDGFLPGMKSGEAPGGWGAGKAAMGRPADVLQMPDGSILISDDAGNRLIRVSYVQ